MSGSTIVVNGVTETVEITKFLEAGSFDFGVPTNWSNGLPSIFVQNDTVYEADISFLAGGAQDGVNVVGGGGQQSDTTAGLLLDEPGASIGIDDYLEVAYLPVINDGNVEIASGGTLQLDGVAIESFPSQGVIDGLPFSVGFVANQGTLNSGNVVEGGIFIDGGVIEQTTQGEVSANTTFENITFEGNLDLTKPGYNIINLNNVTFGDYVGLPPVILMNGTGGVLQSTGDQTLANVTFEFGASVGTIASRGTNSTLTISPTTTLLLNNSDFYVANTDTLINDIELDSSASNEILSFSGQAYNGNVIINNAPTTLAAGVFENLDAIILSNPEATNTIFDMGFTNEANANLSVTDATLDDNQFTSTFENDGNYDIGSAGTVEAYDQTFFNGVSGIIEIGADSVGAGTLALGTMDIQSLGKVFTVAPTGYTNDGLIELFTTAPPASSGTPVFYIGAGTDFSNTGGILFTNDGTILLGAGVFQIETFVTIDGGTIQGDGGSILAGGGTIENAALDGEVNLTTQGQSGGVIWLYDDSYAANAFSSSIINASREDMSLFLRDDSGLSDLVLNLGTTGDPRTSLFLESTTLTVEASSTLNANAGFVTIGNGIIPNVGFLQTTLDNAGLFQALAGVIDIETTGFENSGQFTLSANAEANLFGNNATNQADGTITIDNGAQLEVGNTSTFDSLVNDGSILIEDGGFLSGLVTLTANDPLSIQSGGILAGATLVGGTISGDGGIAVSTNSLDGVDYAGALNVEGLLEVENGTSFTAAGGGPLPDTVNITTGAVGGGAELTFLTATTFTDTTVNIGAATTPYADIDADAAVTLAANVTVNQNNTYAGIDSDNAGALDNKGDINANFLNGTFLVTGLSSLTNDGDITISNGETFEVESSFTETAEGTLTIEAGAVAAFSGGITMPAGAVIDFAAGSTLDVQGQINGGTFDLNGAELSGSSLPGGGVFDGVTIIDTPVTITGTVTFSDVTYQGSPVVTGDLQLNGGNTFQAENAIPPVIALVAGQGTIDFVGSQELDNVAIDLDDMNSSGPAIVMAGSGAADAAVTLGPNLLVDQNGGGAGLIEGTSDDGSSFDNLGSIAANQSAGTLEIQALANFTNDGGITVSNGDDLVVDAPLTENADGTFEVTDPGTLTVDAAMTIASNATLKLDSSSDFVMGGGSVVAAGDGSSVLTCDGAVMQGTGEISGVALLGSPIIDGDLELGANDVFEGLPANTGGMPTVNVNGTLDVLTSQSLTGLLLDMGSPLAPSPIADLVAGLGGVDANVTLAAGSTIDQTGTAFLLTGGSDGNSTVENDGQINANQSSGSFGITSLADFVNVGDIAVANGDSLTAGVTVINNGSIGDQSGATFQQAVNGTGTIGLDDDASVTFLGSVSSGQQIALNDGLIVLDDPIDFAGTVVNFGVNDVFWFPSQTVTDPVYNGSQLIFTNGSDSSVAISMVGDTVDFPGPMQEDSDGDGGFFVGSQFNGNMPCFAAGTRIATDRGPVEVENLRIGDRVPTLDDPAEPIVWLGWHLVDCARHPEPASVWPVRVARGAFGRGTPKRALYLSPDHAVFVAGVLVPVRLLVNGTSIRQEERKWIRYFHVELSRHAVILAEGLKVESFLDTGNRAAFVESAGVARRPAGDVARLWEAMACAPLVQTGARLASVREHLASMSGA